MEQSKLHSPNFSHNTLCKIAILSTIEESSTECSGVYALVQTPQ
jgi:hypothetical protein